MPSSDHEHPPIGTVLWPCCLVRGVAFESESDLRQKGAYKTPDMLLNIPIAVRGTKQEVMLNDSPFFCTKYRINIETSFIWNPVRFFSARP